MPPPENDSAAGFQGPPADGGMSIDRLAQAFAAMMGEPDPYAAAESGAEQLVPHPTWIRQEGIRPPSQSTAESIRGQSSRHCCLLVCLEESPSPVAESRG